MDKNINAEKIIDALGGTSKTARIFNIQPESVCGWRWKGVPQPRIDQLELRHKKLFKQIKEFLPCDT